MSYGFTIFVPLKPNEMKTKILFPILAGALLVCSCGQKSKSLEFEVDTASINEAIPYSETKKGNLAVDYSFEYPSAGEPAKTLETLQKSLIKGLFNDSLSTDFQTALEKKIESLATDYRLDIDDMYSDPQYPPQDYMVDWEDNCTGHFGETHGNVVSYYTVFSSYSGGAHGGYGTRGMLFSLMDGSRVSQDRYFVDGYKKPLTKLLIKHLKDMEDNPVRDLSELFAEPYPNDNIFFQEDGIVFTFETYEIASYAQGQMSSTIPWSEVEPLIRPEFL